MLTIRRKKVKRQRTQAQVEAQEAQVGIEVLKNIAGGAINRALWPPGRGKMAIDLIQELWRIKKFAPNDEQERAILFDEDRPMFITAAHAAVR